MKALFFIVISICCFGFESNAQYWYQTDTTHYSSQHVAIEIGELSPVPVWLKDSLAQEMRDNSDFFDFIHKLNRVGVLTISNWQETKQPAHTPSQVSQLLESAVEIHYFDDPEYHFPYFFYRFLAYNGEPMVHFDGTPILDDRGKEVLRQPDTIDYYFERLVEVRIIETFDYHEQSKAPKIEMIGFVALDAFENYSELFWISYDDLMAALLIMDLDPEQYYWYQKLKARNYKGFRYKQDPWDIKFTR